MSRHARLLIGAIALFQIASPARAAQITPPGYSNFTGSITATVAGTTLVCTANLTLDASPNHYGDAHGAYGHTDVPSGTLKVSSFTLSGTGCGIATLIGMPPTISIGTNPVIVPLSIPSIDSWSFIPGFKCSGSVSGSFNTLTGTINIPNQTMGNCRFQGSLTSGLFQIQM